ncbi:predicted protein [Plenodomus lingam JN3]|uniref:Predicted protein n=1 Tax=Leptosphaeria maculans (strain JN3 / isolate v23.1.3 / race Av1-4-5-6-7-8) TaxID=985895 RepID=E4ZJP9_LEPMJ|nr:predicted protein [Plenodomus lingam JN3]CBX91334.1 predicted protein [Plenodomus lingam JN3]
MLPRPMYIIPSRPLEPRMTTMLQEPAPTSPRGATARDGGSLIHWVERSGLH